MKMHVVSYKVIIKKIFDDMQDLIKKKKSTCSNNLLPLLVQVEHLMQIKQTVTV